MIVVFLVGDPGDGLLDLATQLARAA